MHCVKGTYFKVFGVRFGEEYDDFDVRRGRMEKR